MSFELDRIINELKLANLLDGELSEFGVKILKLCKTFYEENGDLSDNNKSQMALIFSKLVCGGVLTKIKEPTRDDYIKIKPNLLQHKRYAFLFSKDKGKSWFDINALNFVKDGKIVSTHNSTMSVTFPYMPKPKIINTEKGI